MEARNEQWVFPLMILLPNFWRQALTWDVELIYLARLADQGELWANNLDDSTLVLNRQSPGRGES